MNDDEEIINCLNFLSFSFFNKNKCNYSFKKTNQFNFINTFKMTDQNQSLFFVYSNKEISR